VACFHQIEYRISCHNAPSLTLGGGVDYPDLAVKLISLVMHMRAMKHILTFKAAILLSSVAMMSQTTPLSKCATTSSEIVAAYVAGEISLDARRPATEWQSAQSIVFCSDWQGKNPDEQRETKVRVLWSSQTLYLKFECRYRELFLFEDSDSNGRRDHLWDRDVVEAFLQPDPARGHYYREFEVSPNGMWIDLDIFPGGLVDLKSGMKRSVFLDDKGRWAAELSIPMSALTRTFDPTAVWRVNFYRVEGKKEPRAYLAWQPTDTPEPNFHVPAAFGRLRFAAAGEHRP
jgi:cellulose/xylan binding protein with CBM9 domain